MLFAENFESGTKGGFDSETDTQSQLDIVHYRTLAAYPWPGCVPYSGAYCMRFVLSGGTADATYSEGSIDIGNAVTGYCQFDVYFSPSFTATADDIFSLFELQGAAAAITGSIGARITAATGAIQLGIGSAASAADPASFAAAPIQRGVWYTVELKYVCQTGGTGTADLYITRDGDPIQQTPQVSISSATNIAVTDGIVGLQNHLATTTGVILLDNVFFDSARVSPQPRYDIDPVFTQSGHAFLGPGYIAGAAILDGTTPTMKLWDTDSGQNSPANTYVVSLATGATNQSSIGGPLFFQKGCYVELGGTSPIGQVIFIRSDAARGVFGPLYHDDANLRNWARS